MPCKPPIPRWLELQAEIDYWIFVLNKMLQAEKQLSGLDKAIDEATGFTERKRQEAETIMARVKKLKAQFMEEQADE